MPHNSVEQRDLSRAEQFLLDDEKHLRRFRKLREKQKQNLNELNRLMSSAQEGMPDSDRMMEEFARLQKVGQTLSDTLEQIMAENARLVSEESAILHPGVFGSFARLFNKPNEAQLQAEATIKRNALARKAKNRSTQ